MTSIVQNPTYVTSCKVESINSMLAMMRSGLDPSYVTSCRAEPMDSMLALLLARDERYWYRLP